MFCSPHFPIISPATHWRYKIFATRYLRTLPRRDRPMDSRLCAYFMSKTTDDLPQLRHYSEVGLAFLKQSIPQTSGFRILILNHHCVNTFATDLSLFQLALIKILHFIKIRTLAGSDERALLDKTENPLKRTISSQGPDFPSEFLKAFKVPIGYDDTTTILHDKSQSGWLAWDKEIVGFVQAPWDSSPFNWDPASSDALAVISNQIEDPEFWTKLVDRYSQEDARVSAGAFLSSFCLFV